MQDIVLRDIHQPAAPGWWPPAPGWWIVIGMVLAVGVLATVWHLRRQRRKAAIARLFDDAQHHAGSPSERIAALSELLRRAARRRDPAADRLEGSAWLQFLDGNSKQAPFSEGPGRILLDGGFRRSVDEADVAAVLPLARARYLELMTRRR